MSGLPTGWGQAKLEDCAVFNPRHQGISSNTKVSFVPMPAVSDINGEIESPEDRPFSEVSKGYTHFQTGDVIFAKITPCMENGKSAVARDLTNSLACGSTEFHVLRPRENISPDFIWRFLRQVSFRADAAGAMTGAVGQRRVPLDYLKSRTVPLPPLPEQRRIVAKVNNLSGKSRRACEHLDHIPRLAEKYKQAILAAALRGDLTRHLREGNTPEWMETTPEQLFKWASGKNLPIKRQQHGEVPVIGGNGISGYHDEALIDQPTLVIGRVGALCGNVHRSDGPAWITDNAIYAAAISDEVDLDYAIFFSEPPISIPWRVEQVSPT